MTSEKLVLDARDIYYRPLNERIRQAVSDGVTDFELKNVNGQRYLFAGLKGNLQLTVNGVPGQDLAAFMNGPSIVVQGNAQDGVGNTMDEGRIVVHGLAGDVLGYGMRGGKLLIKGDVGYRVGIHMKAYQEKAPSIVIGGKAGDFLGEYMAGGVILLLGMFSDKPDAPVSGRNLGTGMHGGVIYIRGEVPKHQVWEHLAVDLASAEDMQSITKLVADFAGEFGCDARQILDAPFYRLKPRTHRPYGNMYVAT